VSLNISALHRSTQKKRIVRRFSHQVRSILPTQPYGLIIPVNGQTPPY
jgi:hypothetical protein